MWTQIHWPRRDFFEATLIYQIINLALTHNFTDNVLDVFGVQVSKPDCRDVPREVCHPVVKQVPKQVPSKYCDKIEVKKCEPVPQKVRGSAFLKALIQLKYIALQSYLSNICTH